MSTTPPPVALAAGAGRTLPLGVTTVRFLAVSENTGGVSSAEEFGIPAGFDGPPPHVHERTNHSWYVLEDELVLTVEGRPLVAGPGAFVRVPARTPHTFANPGVGPARMLQFTTPGGFEDYLEELTRAFPAGATLDRDRLVEIMARHDTFLV